MNKIPKSILALIILAGCSVNTPEYRGLSEDIIKSKKTPFFQIKLFIMKFVLMKMEIYFPGILLIRENHTTMY
ncbi:MAG TPA: hypothetical protein VMV77_14170 [Bacteroidales bacterium]|nr:hypothetical protein [Bacteroidales bacterium]